MASLNDISLRQLEYVVALAELLNFRRAAERCHVSQPALSAQIQQLERVLGVKVFERDKRRVSLTEAGAGLVEQARRVLAETHEILSTAERMGDPFKIILHLGVIPSVAPYALPELIPALIHHYPQLQLRISEERPRILLDALLDGRLDAALLSLEADLYEVEHVVLAKDPFVVALPPDHLLMRKQQLLPSDLESEQLLLLEEEHSLGGQMPSLSGRLKQGTVDFRAASLTTLVQMVSAGMGITLLPSLAVRFENLNRPLAVRPFVHPAPSRTLALVWRPGSSRTHVLREIGHTLRSTWSSRLATAETPTGATAATHQPLAVASGPNP